MLWGFSLSEVLITYFAVVHFLWKVSIARDAGEFWLQIRDFSSFPVFDGEKTELYPTCR